MRFTELTLHEKSVLSSWITNLVQTRKTRSVVMTLNNGRKYRIDNMSRYKFDLWNQAGSKGKFWHQYVKKNHNVTRIL
jgi:hypothetical protein